MSAGEFVSVALVGFVVVMFLFAMLEMIGRL